MRRVQWSDVEARVNGVKGCHLRYTHENDCAHTQLGAIQVAAPLPFSRNSPKPTLLPLYPGLLLGAREHLGLSRSI